MLPVSDKLNNLFLKLRPFIRFCLVGLANTAIDFTFYISLTRGWGFWQKNYLVANALVFITANIFSFVLNKSWTFKNLEYKNYYWQYGKFFLVSLFSLLIIEATLFTLVEFLQVYDLLAKVVGIALSLLLTFKLHKSWTFKKNN